MRKYCIAITLLLFCFLSICTKAQMREIYRDFQTLSNTFRELSFYNPSSGFLAASDQNQPTLYYTTDSGRTYIKRRITLTNVNFNGYPVNLTFGFYIQGVKAFDANNLIAYGDYGLVPSILRSTNGGLSFTLVYHSQFDPLAPNSSVMQMIFPENNNVGYAVDRDRILKTNDQGQSWSVIRVDAGRKFTRLDGIDNNHVFAFGTDLQSGKLFNTSDGGSNWEEISRPAGTTIQYVDFITASKGWLLAKDIDSQAGLMYYSSDAGNSWSLMNNKDVTPFYCEKMKFINDSTGFAIAGFETYRTTDSGKIWEPMHRENDFVYLGYKYLDLQIIGDNQLWSTGELQLLEINTNLAWPTHPKAIFVIDTTGYSLSGMVQLRNYSKPGMSYAWYINNQLVSTDYHFSYVHDPYHSKDTVRLEVNNGTYNNSTEKEFFFGAVPKPILTQFSPASGTLGSVITIKGKWLSKTTNVYFGNVPASSFIILSDTSLSAVVNDGESGRVRLAASNGADSLAGFTYIPPPPVIETVTPLTATPGSVITIKGKYFQYTGAVRFGGVDARRFQVISKTELRVILGDGASGDITVSTSSGTHSVNGFIVLPLVKVTGFNPVTGIAGSSITIDGQNFDPSIAGNAVFFGGVKGTVMQASPTQLTVTIPIGAGYAPLTIITKDQEVSSMIPFQPSFAGTDTLSDKSFYVDGTYSALINTAGSGALGDLDLDGKLDLVTGTTSIFRNVSVIGKINMTLNRQLGGSFSAQYYKLHDLNSDGKLDLLMGGLSMRVAKNISVPGDINFQDVQTLPDPVNNFAEPAVADLDGDGRPDIAAWVAYSDLLVFRNTSTRDTITFESAIHLPVGDSPWDVVAGDLDGDGKPELIASNYYGGDIYVYHNISVPGQLQFELPISFPVNAGHPVLDLSLADLDNDGRIDIAVGSSANQQTQVALFRNISSGPGNFAFAPHTNITGIPDNNSFEFSDVDGDGKIDLVVANRGMRTVSVSRNRSVGTSFAFSSPVILRPAGSPLSMFAPVGDLDNDGKPDIVFIGSGANTVTFYRNRVGEIIANAGRDSVLCSVGPSITLGVPGVAGHSYRWSSIPAGLSSQDPMPIVTPQQTTYYILQVTSPIGVESTDTVIVQIQNIVADAGNPQYWLCPGATTFIGTAPVPGVRYEWTSNPPGYFNDQPRTAVTPAVTTTYYLRVESAAGCSSTDSVLVTILPFLPTSISISGDTVVESGHSVVLTATFQNGGLFSPVTWQDSTFLHNWRDVPIINGGEVYYQPIYTGDKIRGVLKSNAPCPLPVEAYSNTLQFTITIPPLPTGIPTTPASQFGIKYYPNPVRTDLFIDNLKLSDQWQWAQLVGIDGKIISTPIAITGKRTVRVNTSKLLPGTYWVLLYNSKNKRAVLSFMKQP